MFVVYVCGPFSMKLIPHLGALKKWYTLDSGLMYCVFRNQGHRRVTCVLKSLDRFYDAMLPCPRVVLSVVQS